MLNNEQSVNAPILITDTALVTYKSLAVDSVAYAVASAIETST